MLSTTQIVVNRRVSPEVIQSVRDQIRSRLGSLVQDFQLIGYDDGIVLRGQSRTYYAKQIALHLTMQTVGLPILGNYIEVRG